MKKYDVSITIFFVVLVLIFAYFVYRDEDYKTKEILRDKRKIDTLQMQLESLKIRQRMFDKKSWSDRPIFE